MVMAGVLASVLAATAAAQQKDDEQAIRQVVGDFTKAYNGGDAKAIAALFLPDGEIVNEAGEASKAARPSSAPSPKSSRPIPSRKSKSPYSPFGSSVRRWRSKTAPRR